MKWSMQVKWDWISSNVAGQTEIHHCIYDCVNQAANFQVIKTKQSEYDRTQQHSDEANYLTTSHVSRM